MFSHIAILVVLLYSSTAGAVDASSYRSMWTSEPFAHKCACANEPVTPYEAVSSAKGNCTVQCKGSEKMRRIERKIIWRKVLLKNSKTGTRSQCQIGVLPEDNFCVTVHHHSPGIRTVKLAGCKSNFRYYLPNHLCVDGHRDEVGEQTCKEICAAGPRPQNPQSVNVFLKRATFYVCYVAPEEIRITRIPRSVKYCRAVLSPCSSCFRWGNWTAVSTCSRTCGGLGVKRFRRSCFITERTGLYGERASMSVISTAYCKAHFGGMDSKTERCGSYTNCPEWTEWGHWSGCVGEDSDVTAKRKCRLRRKRGAEFVSTSTGGVFFTTMETKITDQVFATVSSILARSNGFLTLKNRNGNRAHRARLCLPNDSMHSLCLGNSTEYRPCQRQEGQPVSLNPTMATETSADDCEDDGNVQNEITPSKTTKPQLPNFPSYTTTDKTLWPARPIRPRGRTLEPKVRPDRPRTNDNYTVSDDGGFTTVLHTYAPALIAGLLIFIVLLLVALIAICGSRIMQRSRRSRYDVTSPPSFSAGTMGSIPSGFVHGFSHVLGLRHGSGTFGRSEGYVTGCNNAGDAISSRGSCRSVISNNNRSQHRPQIPPALGLAYASNSIRQHSPHQRIALSEIVKRPMGSKKHSDSSLLSSCSSTGGAPHTAPANPCSFPPLPPIPPDQIPHPVGNNKSVFKRGAGRSSSLNPAESDKSASMKVITQPRSDSLGGRVTGRSRVFGSEGFTSQKLLQTPERARGASRGRTPSSSSEIWHCDEILTQENDSQATHALENEYWSVTRSECLDSDDDSAISPHKATNVSTPRAKPREGKRMKSIQAEKSRGSHASLATKLSHETVIEEKNSIDMVENILYAHSANTSACHSHDKADEPPESVVDKDDDFLASPGDGKIHVQDQEEPFYNAIRPSESGRTKKTEPSVSTEGDYDHLCDQFGGPNSTKDRARYPGTMTSLHYLRSDDATKSHDYESIDLEERKLSEKKVDDKSPVGECANSKNGGVQINHVID